MQLSEEALDYEEGEEEFTDQELELVVMIREILEDLRKKGRMKGSG